MTPLSFDVLTELDVLYIGHLQDQHHHLCYHHKEPHHHRHHHHEPGGKIGVRTVTQWSFGTGLEFDCCTTQYTQVHTVAHYNTLQYTQVHTGAHCSTLMHTDVHTSVQT